MSWRLLSLICVVYILFKVLSREIRKKRITNGTNGYGFLILDLRFLIGGTVNGMEKAGEPGRHESKLSPIDLLPRHALRVTSH